MHIMIEDKTVSENVRAFLDLLKKAEAKREKIGAALIEKSYKAFLNRKTGKLVFADAYRDQNHWELNDWKPINVDYSFDPISESFHAMAYEIKERNEAFAFHGLTPSAIKVIKGTIQIVNKLSSLVKGSGSDVVTKIKALCKLQMDVGNIDKEKSILVATWHSVDRLGAEKILKGMAAGTFLFREDYFVKLIEEQLSRDLGKRIKCVTLTIVEPDHKISDFTLVYVDHLWRWYDDVLFCNVKGYAKIEELLDSLFKGRAEFPLYHSYIEQHVA